MIWQSDLLSQDIVEYITSHYKDKNFQCGSISNPDSSVKQNLIMKWTDPYNRLNEGVWSEIKKKDKFTTLYSIKQMSQLYFLWYKPGHFYNWHMDSHPCGGVNADMSMTIFLNDDYEGGELVIKVGNVETSHKPKAGTVVIYNTGMMHKINPVTKGDRKVIVGWLESDIQDSFMRSHLIDYSHLMHSMPSDSPYLVELEQMRLNLIRQYETR
jgi:PKHD-type hydroxylase